MNHNVAAPEHGTGHETKCFWGLHLPTCSHHVGTYCPLLDRKSRPGNGSRGTFVSSRGSPSTFWRCGRFQFTRTRRTSAWLALSVLATAAGSKPFLKLNDDTAAANPLAHHARCCSDKESFIGIHDIASTLRLWQWFSRCECCTCSVCLSSELIESAKPSHMSIVTKSQVHWSATFGMSVHCPHDSKVSVSAASYRCNSPDHQP